jgi:hypothetical protein
VEIIPLRMHVAKRGRMEDRTSLPRGECVHAVRTEDRRCAPWVKKPEVTGCPDIGLPVPGFTKA